ncbi:MAG: peroxiredoxin [Acidobacteria bacterium]|nr:peroxiredoxin [Acidobacteriota bacterium]
MLQVGDQAPDFDVLDHHGNHVKLSDLRGKRVVLWFYPKADTPGCTAEGCSFRDLNAEYKNKNAQILGVSFDTQAENAAFAEKFGFTFPLLCDTDRKIGLAYGAAESEKDEYARRIAYVIGEDGKIEQAHPKVDARTYPAEQLKSL